jgi:hypothetical protein
MNTTNEMQLYRLIYYSYSAPHVSGDVFAHYQAQLTVFTACGNIHGVVDELELSSNSSTTPAGSNVGEH